MMANLAVFHKWHSSGTDNARPTPTHIDGPEEMAQPLRYQPGPHTLISQNKGQSGSQGRTLERGSKQQLYTRTLTQAHVISA